MSRKKTSAYTATAPPRPVAPAREFVADLIDVSEFWGPKTLKPVVVMAQLEARYEAKIGPIRHVDDARYVKRLGDVIAFAQKRQADFCIFPEYSWPLSAAEDLKARLPRSGSCVYVVPFEHMSVADYRALLRTFKVEGKYRDDERDEIKLMRPIGEHEGVVNPALIFIPKKTRYFVVPQRKLSPASLEEWGVNPPQFVGGKTIRVIQSKDCAFAVLICFDFIHHDRGTGQRPRDVLTSKKLDLLFVPECNPKPMHDFYLLSAIDAYQAPKWSMSAPVVAFTNVAAGSKLGDRVANFGFSRMLGNLASVTPSAELLTVEGFASSPSPGSLDGIRKQWTVVRSQDVKSVIFRPDESVFVCELPPLGGGAKRDRTSSDTETNIDIYRPLGGHEDWQRVREQPSTVSADTDGARTRQPPSKLTRPQLQEHFRDLMRDETLLMILGKGGSGKTALVSKMVDEVVLKPTDRLVWIDLSTIENSEAALIEEVLLQIGRASDLAQALEGQLVALREALRRQPTILVLDSATSWDEAQLKRLLDMRGWKTLVVVSGRKALAPQRHRLDIPAMALPDFGEIIKEIAGEVLPALAFVMYVSSEGSALVAAWTGQFIARNREEAKALNEHLADAYVGFLWREGPKLGGEQPDSLPSEADAERLMQAPPPITLKGIYEWFKQRLSETALAVLDVLCEMPAGMRAEDLREIIAKPVDHAVETLDARNFLQVVSTDGIAPHTLYTSHPFVRQLWEAAARPRNSRFHGFARWTERVLNQYGRDRDPRVSPIVVRQWANLSHFLRGLAKSRSKDERRAFLKLWRIADGFLWAAGRWRERLIFGAEARRVAHDLKDVESEILALYDAQAETRWHLDENSDEAAKLLDTAAELAEKHRHRILRARIEWYRSRLLLQVPKVKEALEAAERAVRLANASKDAETKVMAQIALGNAHRDDDNPEAAMDHYISAKDLLPAMPKARFRESAAVLERNFGRIFLRVADYAQAIRHFESAIDQFMDKDLGLVVQAAITAVYNAEALARADEPDTAQRHLDWGRLRLDPLGSVLRQRSMAAAQRAIDDARLRR